MNYQLLKINHLKIHNANALSSPITIGFPAMTAWMGFMHAFQRKVNNALNTNLKFSNLAIVSHSCQLQTYKINDFDFSIIGTRNPMIRKGSDFVSAPFIEEARCELDVSLLIRYQGSESDRDTFEKKLSKSVSKILNSLKVAGGDILDFELSNEFINSLDESQIRKLTTSLMPGYVLIERNDLMKSSMNDGNDALDALLNQLTVENVCEGDENDFAWIRKRKQEGWVIPIAVGFHGVSPLAIAKNQRDEETLHRFAESIITLGEFKMIYQIKHLEEVFWNYQVDLEKNLYLCKQ